MKWGGNFTRLLPWRRHVFISNYYDESAIVTEQMAHEQRRAARRPSLIPD
jgi:hypothetical protein